MEFGLINSNGEILKNEERYINSNSTKEVEGYIVNEIISILKNWNAKEGIKIDKIGIGAPGIIKENEIKYSANLGVRNFKLVDELKKYFPKAKIKLQNDAKCSAMAEKKWGNLKQYEDCIFVGLGTGIGGAAFINGKMLEPKRNGGFEFGHTIMVKDGILCRCGSKGCFEQYGSMKSLKKSVKSALNLSEEIDGDELFKIVEESLNNEDIKKIIDDYTENLCIGLSNIVNIIEPQAICLGGGFVKYKDILLEKLEEKFYSGKYLFYKEQIPKIVVAKFGNDAGMIGSTINM